MKSFLTIACFVFFISAQDRGTQSPRQAVVNVPPPQIDKVTDSLHSLIKQRASIADNNQEEILTKLKKLQKQLDSRPVKYLYRTRIVHDTIPAECAPDTVILRLTKRQIRLYNKQHKQQP